MLCVLDVRARAVCNRVSLTVEELERVCCLRAHDVYKEILEAAAGEVLNCERKAPTNTHDLYAVAVKVTGTTDIAGHLPQKVSRVCCSSCIKEEL